MTSSSDYSSSYDAKYGRLDGQSSWCPAANVPGGQVPERKSWLQINLVVSHIIGAFATQGDPKADKWVIMYKMAYSLDGRNWKYEAVSSIERGARIIIYIFICFIKCLSNPHFVSSNFYNSLTRRSKQEILHYSTIQCS